MTTETKSKRQERPEIITIRVKDTGLKWKLKEAAAKAKTTVSAMVEQFLNDGLARLAGGKNDQNIS